MSWLFSRALVGEFLPDSCSVTEPSAPSSGTDTPQAFSSDAKTTEAYRRSRYGMTCGPLTEDLGVALLTAFQAAFHARTLAAQEGAPALMANGLASGGSLPAWFAKWSPQSSEWKTAQCSLVGGLESFSETWPRSGLMLDGTCYPQPAKERITSANASGLLPTLTVCGNYNRTGASKTSGMGLATAIKLMPTLCARDFRYPGKSRLERTGSKSGEVLPQIVGGPLNPDWCEWFMGFPIGWTESAALETRKFREWQQQHGGYSVAQVDVATIGEGG